MSAPTSTIPRYLSTPLRAIVMVAGGLILFVGLLVAAVLGYEVLNDGYIYPGVSVGHVDLSGLTPEAAVEQLAANFTYPEQGKILLRDGERIWVASPADVGLYLGPEHNAMQAYNVGRSGTLVEQIRTQYDTWRSGRNLEINFVFDEQAAYRYLQAVAEQIDLPSVEATLEIDGLDVITTPGQIGRTVNVPATASLLAAQVETLRDGDIQLMIDETPPAILDASTQAETARAILSESLQINVPGSKDDGPGPWVFEPDDLAKLLVIERVENMEDNAIFQILLDERALRTFFTDIADDLKVEPQDARYIFNDDSRELDVIQAAVIGEHLDVEASIEVIQKGIQDGEHSVNLDMHYTEPDLTDDLDAASMGITELVSSHTSYFYGSSGSRIQNITTASSRFHGVMVAPGETFSMAEVLGDVSLDTGYAEAWIIYGDRTIKGVGGGVCQVSTTLFRTVFFGGFPVNERHPHAYRVYYYEQTPSGGVNTNLAGLDATVYVPLVDFKFTNDTENWLLMETYVNAAGRSLTWKFYSTSDGRTVEWETTGLKDKEDPPEPKYIENDELSKGTIKQVDWAVEGAEVTISRYVHRDGSIIHSDTFYTKYMPWRAVCEYGPGTPGMPPKEPDPDNPCKPVK